MLLLRYMHRFFLDILNLPLDIEASFIVLFRLEKIAKSSTDEEYASNVNALTASAEWQDDASIQSWMVNKWFPHYKVLNLLALIVCVCFSIYCVRLGVSTLI